MKARFRNQLKLLWNICQVAAISWQDIYITTLKPKDVSYTCWCAGKWCHRKMKVWTFLSND